MKHKPKITILLLSMFIVTQFIGLYVINHYSPIKITDGKVENVTASSLPYGLEPPEIEKESDYNVFFYGIIIAFILAICLLFFLTKFKLEIIIKIWFFGVITIALGIFLNSLIPQFKYASLVVLVFALPLAFIKIFKRNIIIHNATELMIYPGIATIFVPILNVWTIIIFLLVISAYDIWAVWRSGIMQKMAKYQIEKLNIFSGFFIPHISEKVKAQIKKLKAQKNTRALKSKKIRINAAILGGGDVVFPIITAGVILRTGIVNLPFGLKPFIGGFKTIFGMQIPLASILVILGAALGLTYLFLFSEKKKFYPAMPFISAGIFLGLLLSYLLS